jgi:hypothetical protein
MESNGMIILTFTKDFCGNEDDYEAELNSEALNILIHNLEELGYHLYDNRLVNAQ